MRTCTISFVLKPQTAHQGGDGPAYPAALLHLNSGNSGCPRDDVDQRPHDGCDLAAVEERGHHVAEHHQRERPHSLYPHAPTNNLG